jgi:exonuclease III
MTKALKLAVWNANGLCQHAQEIRQFIKSLDLDILLVSETHFKERSYMSIPNYHIYRTDHPDKTAHGGTAVIILKHHVRAEYRHEHLQATTIAVEDNLGELTIPAAYCPPQA